MSGLVKSHGVPLGTTKAGADWALKALHPAEDVGENGYPDGSVSHSVVISYVNQFSLAPTAPAANWDCDINLFPNPIDLIGVQYVVGGVGSWYNGFNHQFETTTGTRTAALEAFGAMVEQYRCLWSSITVHLNATATTDSGVVACAQYPWVPKLCDTDLQSATHTAYTMTTIWPDQLKTYQTLLGVQGGYTGDARDGVYSVLKLTDFHWQQANDYSFHINAPDSVLSSYPDKSMAFPLAGVSVAGPPYGLESAENGLVQAIYEVPSSGRSQSHLSFRNINQTATLEVWVRSGFEYRVTPGTSLAPLMRSAPLRDNTAMEAYSAINISMAAAYPESYNSLGTLIKPILNLALEYIPRLIPGLKPLIDFGKVALPAISGVVKAARDARAAAQARRNNGKQVSVPSKPTAKAMSIVNRYVKK